MVDEEDGGAASRQPLAVFEEFADFGEVVLVHPSSTGCQGVDNHEGGTFIPQGTKDDAQLVDAIIAEPPAPIASMIAGTGRRTPRYIDQA